MENLRRLGVVIEDSSSLEEMVLNDVWVNLVDRLDTAYVYRGGNRKDLKVCVRATGRPRANQILINTWLGIGRVTRHPA